MLLIKVCVLGPAARLWAAVKGEFHGRESGPLMKRFTSFLGLMGMFVISEQAELRSIPLIQ